MKGKKPEMMTAVKFAEESGISYPTVLRMLRNGAIEGATKEEDDRGSFWRIPRAALKSVIKPANGRPRKETKGKANGANGKGN
jgi:hypothetical protein